MIKNFKQKAAALTSLFCVMVLSQNCIEVSDGFSAKSADLSSNTQDSTSDVTVVDPVLPVVPEPEEPIEPEAPTLSPAFLAVGHQGSSMYSCDGGLSWEGYRAMDPQRCDDPNLVGNCDHQDLSGKGVVWTPSGFVLHYGHGGQGPVQRSSNGDDWETLLSDVQFGDIAYGDGTIVLAKVRDPLYSDDDGETFNPTDEKEWYAGNVRAATFIPHGTGVFLVQSAGGGNSGIFISSDKGKNYEPASVRPANCNTGNLAYSDTRIVISSTDLCYSDDAGDTWTVVPGFTDEKGEIVYDGSEFKLIYGGYSGQTIYSSADGINWTSGPVLVDGVRDTAFKVSNLSYYSEFGRFVAIDGSYEGARFLHSTDGANWTTVSDPTKKPSSTHPVRNIAAGYLEECN